MLPQALWNKRKAGTSGRTFLQKTKIAIKGVWSTGEKRTGGVERRKRPGKVLGRDREFQWEIRQWMQGWYPVDNKRQPCKWRGTILHMNQKWGKPLQNRSWIQRAPISVLLNLPQVRRSIYRPILTFVDLQHLGISEKPTKMLNTQPRTKSRL